MRLLAAILLCLALAGGARAQNCPSGSQLNPYRIVVGTTPCTVAGGDQLAAEIARAMAAEATKLAASAVGSTVAPLSGGVVPPANLPTASALGGMLAANNLSDVASATAARANLGLGATSVLGVGSGLTAVGSSLTANVQAVFGRTGAISLLSSDVASALGFTPYSAANPSAFITAGQAPVQSVFGRAGAVALEPSDITTALGFAPYSAANPLGYITASGAPVQSVFGRSGAVSLLAADVSLALGFTPYSASNPASFITAAQAPVQSVASLTGSVTSAQLVTSLGGTSGVTLAFGNDSRLVGAIQSSTYGQPNGTPQLDGYGHVPSSQLPQGAVINFASYGAKCNGTTDDSGAFNQATAAGLAVLATGVAPNFVIPAGKCLIQANGVNLTGFSGLVGGQIFGFTLTGSGAGSVIDCKTTGAACLDMLGSGGITLSNFVVLGDATNIPSIGIQVGRTLTHGGCSNSGWDNVGIYGSFSFTGVYNFACETNVFTNLNVFNHYNKGTATSCFSLVQDGLNYWNVRSAYIATYTTSVNTYHSFNENTFLTPTLFADGGCSPVWMSATRRHKYVGGYIASFSSPYNVVLWSSANQVSPTVGDANYALSMDAHMESGTYMQYEVYLTGTNPTPNLDGLYRREHDSEASTAIFGNSSAITGVTMPDADIDFVNLAASSVFSNPSIWNVSGQYYLPSGSAAWNLTCGTNFYGRGQVGLAATQFCGNGAGLTNVTAATPTNLVASSVTNAGSVSAINVAYGGHYNINSWCNSAGASCLPQYAHIFPSVTLNGGGGANASANVSGVAATNTALSEYQGTGGYIVPSAGGSGYAVNNEFTLANASSYCSTPPIWKVQTLNGNAVATYGVNTAGVCQTLPPEPISTSDITGSGSGVQLSGLTWAVASIAFSPGSGFTSNPTVSIQTSNYNSSANATATASISASLSVSSASGSLLLNSSGTTIGIAGTNGSPLIHASATEDATIQSWTPASGATIAAPANSDAGQILGSTTLPTLTFELPALTGHIGQQYALSITPAITTLTVQTSGGGAVSTTSSTATAGAPQVHTWKVLTVGGPWTQWN